MTVLRIHIDCFRAMQLKDEGLFCSFHSLGFSLSELLSFVEIPVLKYLTCKCMGTYFLEECAIVKITSKSILFFFCGE